MDYSLVLNDMPQGIAFEKKSLIPNRPGPVSQIQSRGRERPRDSSMKRSLPVLIVYIPRHVRTYPANVALGSLALILHCSAAIPPPHPPFDLRALTPLCSMIRSRTLPLPPSIPIVYPRHREPDGSA